MGGQRIRGRKERGILRRQVRRIHVNCHRERRLLSHAQEVDRNMAHAALEKNVRAPIHNLEDLGGSGPHTRMFMLRLLPKKGDKITLTYRELLETRIVLQDPPRATRQQGTTYSTVCLHADPHGRHEGTLCTRILKKRMIGCCRLKNVRLDKPENTLRRRKPTGSR